MKYYGTKNNKDYGFYLTNFDGAVEITDEKWKNLLLEQNYGKIIIPYNGDVVAVDENEYELRDNVWIKLSTDEFQYKQLKIENEIRKKEIFDRLKELDEKRIRAVCEPELMNEEEGITWLEYYNREIKILRDEYAAL